jgi:hypothetical protein
MLTVEQLAQHLLSLNPKSSPARLAFYHYIKNFLKHEATFTQEMIDSFYDRAMTYQYWQINKKILGETIQADLEAIAVRQQFAFDVSGIIHSAQLQVISLENRRDFLSIIEAEIKVRSKNGENIKTFSWTDKDLLLISLNSKGLLSAEIKTPVAFVVDGQLQLVRPHSRIIYSAELEFLEGTDQYIQTSAMRIARFQAQGSRIKGQFIQGTSFHTAEGFDKPIDSIPELFQSVKSLERFFVNPVTDPYFQNFMTTWGQSVQNHKIDP